MIESNTHYLTFSCYKRHWLFKDSHVYQLFVNTLQRSREKYEFELYAWVVMPNHVHLLVTLPDNLTVPRLFQYLKRIHSVHAIRYLKEHDPGMADELTLLHGKRRIQRFWQAGGGYDRVLRTNDRVVPMANYIHNNPVVKGLAKDVCDYPWSSARYWGQGDTSLLEMDDPGFIR